MLLQLSQSQAGTLDPPTEQTVRSAEEMPAAAGGMPCYCLAASIKSGCSSPLGLLQHRSCLRVKQSLMEMHVLARGLAAVHHLLKVLLQAAAALACINLQGSQHVGCLTQSSRCRAARWWLGKQAVHQGVKVSSQASKKARLRHAPDGQQASWTSPGGWLLLRSQQLLCHVEEAHIMPWQGTLKRLGAAA